jgi:hypothetical protein
MPQPSANDTTRLRGQATTLVLDDAPGISHKTVLASARRVIAKACEPAEVTAALDENHERTGDACCLAKEQSVLAHCLARPLAAE